MVVYYILYFQLQHLYKVFLHTSVRCKLVFCFWILLHISYCTLCKLPKVPIYRRLKDKIIQLFQLKFRLGRHSSEYLGYLFTEIIEANYPWDSIGNYGPRANPQSIPQKPAFCPPCSLRPRPPKCKQNCIL